MKKLLLLINTDVSRFTFHKCRIRVRMALTLQDVFSVDFLNSYWTKGLNVFFLFFLYSFFQFILYSAFGKHQSDVLSKLFRTLEKSEKNIFYFFLTILLNCQFSLFQSWFLIWIKKLFHNCTIALSSTETIISKSFCFCFASWDVRLMIAKLLRQSPSFILTSTSTITLKKKKENLQDEASTSVASIFAYPVAIVNCLNR